jgi:hypothetical protein
VEKMKVQIPIEYLPDFMRMPATALRQYGNIATTAFNIYYFNWINMRKCYSGSNPFNERTLLFDKEYVCRDRYLRYGHIDLSKSGDACGVCFCHIPNFIHLESAMVEGKVEKRELFPFIKIDYIARIIPKEQGGLLDPALIRETCIYEFMKRGFRIGLVTFDGYQSWESIVRLREKGIPSEVLSIDRTISRILVDFSKTGFVRKESIKTPTAPHELHRDIVSDFRLNLPFYKFIEQEMQEQDEVDNLVVKIAGGTDDVIQSVVGAEFNAVNNTLPFIESRMNSVFDESQFTIRQHANSFRDILGEKSQTTKEVKKDKERKINPELDGNNLMGDSFSSLLDGQGF